MEFGILGPLEVRRDGTALALGGAKQRALLAILLVHANRVLSAERVVELLWGDHQPATAEHTLEVRVSQLRKTLEPEGAPYKILKTTPAGYTLSIESNALDAVMFQALIDGAMKLGPGAKVDQLNKALALWRGPALAEFASESFAVGTAARLHDLRLLALEERIDAELDLGRHAALIGELVSLTKEYPLRERLCGQLMLALYRSGRQAEASDVYQRTRDRLVEELGMEPGSELQTVLKRILQHDPLLDVPSPADGEAKGQLNNLPLQLTNFIGRREQLRLIETSVNDFRLVTLVGVGGSGKTRLALEVATALLGQFPGGTWFIDLASVSDPELIWQSLTAAIGIKEEAGKPLETTAKEYLQKRATLLLVDNCEHLITTVADMLETLLVACGDLHVLATSRERLRIAGEHVYEVPPLEVPATRNSGSFQQVLESEAVQLFADRASMSHPFSITTGNVAAVAELCRRLDGIPLAIELAAARTQILTPAQLLERLEGSFAVLKTDRHSAADRQRTLLRTVDWSYQLLSRAEQDLFDQLSVFAGTFDLRAAETLGGSETLDLLGALIDKSLVVRHSDADSGMRYRLLETLRQYGQEHLRRKGVLDLARDRHASYYLALAHELDRHDIPDASRSLSNFQIEEANFRGALDWLRSRQSPDGLRLANSLARYWKASGSVAEGRLWLDSMIAIGSPDKALLSTALYRVGLFAYYARDNDTAWEQMRASVELKRGLGDDAGVARRLGSLAEVAMARGDEASALQLAEEGKVLSARLADARSQAWANVHLAFIQIIKNEGELAARLLSASLPALRAAADYAGQAYAIGGLALVDFDKGDVRAARPRITELFELVDRHSLWNENPGWLWGGLLLAEAEGRYEEAVLIAGAIQQREKEGKGWHITFATRYRSAIDRAMQHLNPGDADRLLVQGAAMLTGALVGAALGGDPGSAPALRAETTLGSPS